MESGYLTKGIVLGSSPDDSKEAKQNRAIHFDFGGPLYKLIYSINGLTSSVSSIRISSHLTTGDISITPHGHAFCVHHPGRMIWVL